MKAVLVGLAAAAAVAGLGNAFGETIVRKIGSAPDAPWRYEERKSAPGIGVGSRRPDTKRGAVSGGTAPVITVKTFEISSPPPSVRVGSPRERRYQHVEKYPDGKVKANCEMLEIQDGDAPRQGPMPDGRYIEYSRNGAVFKRGQYSRGKSDGTWTEYTEGGEKRWEGTFKSGLKEGEWTEWYKADQKLRSGIHANNLREGMWTDWHPNGLQAAQGMYFRGQKHGRWVYWAEAGNCIAEVTYNHGRTMPRGKGSAEAGSTSNPVLCESVSSVTPATSVIAPGIPGTEFWCTRLKDQRVEFRVQAATELGNLRECAAEAGRALGEALFDSNHEVRQAAANSLEGFGAGAGPCVPAISRLLDSPQAPLPHGVIRILKNCSAVAGGTSVAVVNAIASGRLRGDREAAEFLLSTGPRAVQYVASRLVPDDAGIRRLIEVAAHLAPKGKLVTPSLARLLRANSDIIRWRSAEALGSLGVAANAAAVQLTVALDDSSSRVRAAAAKALGVVGTLPERSVGALERTLLDPDQQVRWAAAESLGRVKAGAGK